MSKKPIKTLILFVLISACAMSQVFAQDVQLSLKDAVETGVVNSLDVKSAYSTLQKAVNTSKVNTLVPSLSLGATATENVDLLNISSKKASDFYPTINVSAGITWSFGTSTLVGKEVDKLTLQKANLTYQSKVYAVRDLITLDYWNIVNLRNKVRIAQESCDTAQTNLDRTTELYQGSKATSTALTQSRLALADAKYNLQTAQDKLEAACDSFTETTGIQNVDQIQFESMPDLDSYDFTKLEALVDERLNTTTDWQLADVSRDLSLATSKKTTLNARVPSLTTKIDTSYSFTNKTTEVKSNNKNLTATGTVSVNIPLDSYIPGTQSNANVKNADLDKQIAEITWEDTTNTMLDSAKSSLKTIGQLVEARSTLQEYVESSKENYQLVSSSYQEGYASATELTNALSSYTTAYNKLEDNSMSLVTNLCTISSLVEMDFGTLMEALR